jgi:hypothetical protein
MAAAPVDGGDLGAIEDVDLRAAVEGSTVHRESAASQPAAGTATGDGDDSGETVTTTTAPSEEAGSSAATGGTAPPACEESVRVGDPTLGALVYRATGTYEDEPAEVLAFDVVDEDGTVYRRVYVVTVDDCAIKKTEQYAA